MSWETLINAGRFILVIGGMIFVHELGHFLVAKWRGIYVHCFSLGFGPKLVGFRKGETEYKICLIPLGGYVKMAGQEDLPEKEREQDKDIPPERSYLNKKTWEKVAVIAAGPLMNILSALVIFSFLYTVGFGVPAFSLSTRVGWTSQSSPATKAGIQPGDYILTMDSDPVQEWEDVIVKVILSGGEPMDIAIRREDKIIQLTATAELLPGNEFPSLGIFPWPQAVVNKLVEGMPAQKAGLQPGDWIRSLDGKDISYYMLFKQISQQPGQKVRVGVVREGVYTQLDIPIAATGEIPGYLLTQGKIYPLQEQDEEISPESNASLIVSIDGEKMTPKQVDKFISGSPERTLVLGLENKKEGKITNWEKTITTSAQGKLGVILSLPENLKVIQKVPFPQSLLKGTQVTWQQARLWVIQISALARGKLSPKNVRGPIMIYQATGEVAKRGLSALLIFVAKICVILGMVNLLPIPILDGGHILIALIEGIRRKPLGQKTTVAIQYVGLAIIAGIFILVFYNDIFSLL